MGIIVQKYGGTSVANVKAIKQVAKKVAEIHNQGNQIVVVLSAMAGETDKLIELANQINRDPNEREYDALLSIGEQKTITLLAMALRSMGIKAQSLLGHQVKITTDRKHTDARIITIDTTRIERLLQKNYVVVVAGFQGIDEENNITTLGRGGSDTTAVALAAALKADLCEICTDVDGIYTTDPKIYKKARRLKSVSYDEILEMASLGAKVMQIRSVEFAKNNNVPILVKLAFGSKGGTMINNKGEEGVVTAVICDKNQARLTITKVPNKPGVASKIISPVSEDGIVVDMIVQNISGKNKADVSFTVPEKDFKRALKILGKTAENLKAETATGDPDVTKISIVGIGMKDHSGIAAKMFEVLGKKRINILMISTSEIVISCVIKENFAELAVNALHTAFGLDKK